MPPDEAKGGTLVVVKRMGQSIDILRVEGIANLMIRLDDRLANLDEPVRITHSGRILYEGTPLRTIGTLAGTLASRGDRQLVFSAEVTVNLAEK